jgi:glycosyltransferase involved in cell wall biosynthesis
LIQDGVTGLLYTPGNYKELAQKIEYLYSNPMTTEQMGKNAKEWASKNFTEERYGEELIHVLLHVAKSDIKDDKSQVEVTSHH